MCIQSTFFRQRDTEGERTIVQLFNGLDSSNGHGLPEVDVPLREEAVPVGGIRLRWNNKLTKRVHLEPEGVDLSVVPTGDFLEVRVPPIAVHSMVVIEY